MANNDAESSLSGTPEILTCKRNGSDITNSDILAGLCVDAEADSTDIRDCIRLYKESFTTGQLTTVFNQVNKSILVQTLNFLGAATPLPEKSWDDYLRPTCIRELIVRIQNLLIDKCGFCHENYACQRTDRCYLKCCNCGQFAHQECIQNILGEHFNSNMSEDDVHNIIFPFKLNCYFFCHECSAKTVPQSTTGLKKKGCNKSVSTPAPESQNVLDLNKETDSVIKPDGNQGDIVTVDVEKEIQKKGTVKICHFYRKGNCKHGKSGENCKFSHPSYCKPLLMFGDNHPKGCNKGQSCQFLHPKMCYNSMIKHQCYNLNCKYFHVKHTKRVPPKRVNKLQNARRERNWQNSLSTAKQDYSAATSNTDTHHINAPRNQDSSEHFLGLFQQMKSDLLQTINQKFAMMSNVSMGQPNPHYTQSQIPLQEQYHPQNQIANHNVWMQQPHHQQLPIQG